jgi:alpha-tubulin suppressor-like RCC1 family protein
MRLMRFTHNTHEQIRIVELALGDNHMMALDEKGIPYAWGNGSSGQLGHGELAEKERVPRPIEMCRRSLRSSSGFDVRVRDLEWGSFYFKKERVQADNAKPGHEQEEEKEIIQKGKVVMIAANGNYSLFVLERLANEAEITAYNNAVKNKLAVSKKMTNKTVIRELFGCGSGKGGVLQSVGKETEYLPKLLPELETGELMQDVIKISAGKAHVGIIVREDHLRNVESKNIDDKTVKDQEANRLRKQAAVGSSLLDLCRQDMCFYICAYALVCV